MQVMNTFLLKKSLHNFQSTQLVVNYINLITMSLIVISYFILTFHHKGQENRLVELPAECYVLLQIIPTWI